MSYMSLEGLCRQLCFRLLLTNVTEPKASTYAVRHDYTQFSVRAFKSHGQRYTTRILGIIYWGYIGDFTGIIFRRG